jgi:hypothetical protein
MAGLGLVIALANPVLLRENVEPLTDIVVLMVDQSRSQTLGARSEQTQRAQAQIEARIASFPNTELRIVPVFDAPDNRGSLMMIRLSEALAEEPRARVAGVLILSDGLIHDAHLTSDIPAPLHLLLTGQPTDWDRRLIVRNAPAFAILGEEFSFTLEIEDQGRVPEGREATSPLYVSIDGGDPLELSMPVGREVEVPLTLEHGGINTLHFSIPTLAGELTDQNNQAVVQVNGVRDRLRVLLVSGEPHNGERTWRNILTSDTAVDLVHFTILRPLEKQDGVPITELALVAFPTRELFLEKIDDFDLIIFDRYKLRGILPSSYLDNIARYAEDGGAILISAGADFASANSLYRSPLGRIMPAKPTGRVFEEGYLPRTSDLGQRHPVTRGLEQTYAGLTRVQASAQASVQAGGSDEILPSWGRWFRQVELEAISGEVIMSGIDDTPLLVLDHVGAGRVAVLGSDQAWLWARGFEGGGPQNELLRRLAHWMMQEPDLEEEMLSGVAGEGTLTVIRRTLSSAPQSVDLINPDGAMQTIALQEETPGVFTATVPALEQGGYRLKDAGRARDEIKEAVVIVGPTPAREFEQTIASAQSIEGVVREQSGAVMRLFDGVPDIRIAQQGRPTTGRNWIGITPRGAQETLSQSSRPAVPTWLWALALAALAIAAWLREGRRA